MSQHDYGLDNQAGAAFRSDLNDALEAIVTLNEGASAPSTTFARMLWYDTTNAVLWTRNGSNTDWAKLLVQPIPQVSKSEAYTAVIGDANHHLLHPTADNNPRTFTIPANGSVAYPVGTALTFVNQINTLTIAITSDTLVLAGSGGTGSRTLQASGIAVALKIASTTWLISGVGLA